jgi:drug/metabolite transporter (DMT)-like permease
LLFILIFNLIAKTSQVLGVSVASVATKMSLTIPVLFGVFLYKEDLGLFKIIGVLMALAAVYFVSVKGNGRVFSIKDLYLPSMVFLGSGLIDAAIQYGEQVMVPENEFPLFSATVFACAACWGVGFVSIKMLRTPMSIQPRTLIGGIALGVPNYFTVYFLLRALQNEVLNSASVFTINNVAVVMICTLLGIVLFKEVISPKNWIGIFLAVISIILVIVF